MCISIDTFFDCWFCNCKLQILSQCLPVLLRRTSFAGEPNLDQSFGNRERERRRGLSGPDDGRTQR